MKQRFGYPPMSVACRSCSKARLFSAASTLKSRMIALRSRHFRKRAPDLRNSARLNTIPDLLEQEVTHCPGGRRASTSEMFWSSPDREAEAVYDEVGELIPELCL